MKPFQLFAFLSASAFVLTAASAASATVFSIDQLKITRSNAVGAAMTDYFIDDFDDGAPPPTGENLLGGTMPLINYTTSGVFGPENSGGNSRLMFDTDDGQVLTSTINGDTFQRHRARLQTNTQNVDGQADRNFGLKAEHQFDISLIIDLSTLPVTGQNVGLRLEDFGGNSGTGQQGDDVLFLRVLKSTTTGNLVISFARIDSLNNVITPLEGDLLEAGHDQIRLTLSKEDHMSSAITASYAYIDGGVAGATTTFATTADIFNGEVHTRAAIYSSTTLPEPGALALFGLGLAGLGIAARRKR